jgi:hypothetical protein
VVSLVWEDVGTSSVVRAVEPVSVGLPPCDSDPGLGCSRIVAVPLEFRVNVEPPGSGPADPALSEPRMSSIVLGSLP